MLSSRVYHLSEWKHLKVFHCVLNKILWGLSHTNCAFFIYISLIQTFEIHLKCITYVINLGWIIKHYFFNKIYWASLHICIKKTYISVQFYFTRLSTFHWFKTITTIKLRIIFLKILKIWDPNSFGNICVI